MADQQRPATYNQKPWTLYKSSFIYLKGQPCKVTDVTYKTVKSKCVISFTFEAYNIFDGTKVKDSAKSDASCTVPFVGYVEYKIIAVSADGLLTLMTENDDDEPRNGHPLSLPLTEPNVKDDLLIRTRKKVEEGKYMVVDVESSMGRERIISVREITESFYPREYLPEDYCQGDRPPARRGVYPEVDE